METRSMYSLSCLQFFIIIIYHYLSLLLHRRSYRRSYRRKRKVEERGNRRKRKVEERGNRRKRKLGFLGLLGI